ncbi:hypothetical protein N7376_23685 [Brucella intermedia GD04153]|uniref:Asparagine synthetase domain-containing protein n=1 Tax=Brucella intermedia GD04153 TaxID=2975438 RepID=A0AA42H1K3_9HYPH|nr:hypothetical protein [Brucella intermedia]MDH0126976.1 hypothetical protein [Brucella intermedia GD04153]
MDFKVIASISDGMLKARIVEDTGWFNKYFFYLLKDGVVIDRQGWLRKSSFEWQLTEPGRYSVRGFVENRRGKWDRFSNAQRMFPKSISDDWDNISATADEVPDLPLGSLTAPHQDFLVAIGRHSQVSVPGFLKTNHPSITSITAYHREPINSDLVFSGSAFLGNNLIFGQSDAEKRSDELMHKTGDYTFVSFGSEHAIISNDYFGVQKLFLYETDDGVVVSNRAHLLCLFLRLANESLSLNKQILTSILAGGWTQVFQQILGDRLAIDGMSMLPIDKYVHADATGYRLENKPIHEIINRQQPNRSMSDLIDIGKDDILAQTEAVLSSAHFKHVLVDATGGMDSRALVAAASNFQEPRHRIRINAADTASIPLDIRVACSIASELGLSFDDLAETVKFVSKRKRQENALSILLGTYFAHNIGDIFGEIRNRDSTVNITGFFGEICLRPYYSRNYIKLPIADYPEIDKFIDFLRNENRATLGGDKEKNILYSELRTSLQNLPGRTPIEKYDLHYLFYRNGLHCSDLFRFRYDTPRIGVLQSPALFEAKLDAYRSEPVTYLQNELISRLNPNIMAFPYASEKDNMDLNATKERLSLAGISPKPILPSGEKAISARARKSVEKMGDPSLSKDGLDLQFLAKRAVVSLYKADYISKDFGMELMSEIDGGKMNNVIINKALMMYHLWRITQMNQQEAESLI